MSSISGRRCDRSDLVRSGPASSANQTAWLSARRHTFPQFESRAAAARGLLLARLGVPNPSTHHLSPLDHDALFWRASSSSATSHPVSVDYTSDIPGSGSSSPAAPTRAPRHVSETGWNMRGVARAPGSLLRFLRDEVPGVTTPMLYVAMLFSWFAWHV